MTPSGRESLPAAAEMAAGARSATPAPSGQRVAFICESAEEIRQLCGPLLEALSARRHMPVLLAGDVNGREERQGGPAARTVRVPLGGDTISPLADFRSVLALTEALRALSPGIAVCTGFKGLVYGSIAAARAQVPRIVALVTTVPGEQAWETNAFASRMTRPLWRKALGEAHHVLALGHARKAALLALGVLSASTHLDVTSAPGIDLEACPALPLPPLGGGIAVLAVAPSGGVAAVTFRAAAHIVKARARGVRFILAGPDYRGADPDGLVEQIDSAKSVREAIAGAHLLVFAGDAGPALMQHALAAGRPIIVMDSLAARDAVEPRVNGWIAPGDDAPGLAETIGMALKRPDLLPSMALASRKRAEQQYDCLRVAPAMLAALGLG